MSISKPDVMVFINPTDQEINLDAVGLPSVPAKGEIDVPLHLAAPTRKDSGRRGPSALETVAPQLTPKHEADAIAFKAIPGLPTPVSKIVSVAARPPIEAPGVKALREQREFAEAKKTGK